MKQLRYISTLLLSLFLLNGCYDLDQYPADSITAGTFWHTQEDADQAMMGIYNAMKKDDAFGIYYTRDCLTDIGDGYNGGVYGYTEVAQAKSSAADGVYLSVWTRMYDGIARANTFLAHVGDVDMSDQLKAQYMAEARFMRALFYNELLNLYGGVPLYDEQTLIDKDFANMLNPRSDEEAVRSFILADLEAAAKNLPAQRNADTKGRATQGAAYALKGKVLLYAGQYQEAAKAFEQVVNGGYGYTLYPDYADLFKPGGDESSEMIFAIQNLGGAGTEYGMPVFYIGNRSSYGGCINCLVPSNKLVDMYEYKDGRPFNWDEVFPGFTANTEVKEKVFACTFDKDGKYVETYPEYREQLLAMYDQRDPRMQQTILLPYTIYPGWVNNEARDCEFVIAYSNPSMENNGYVRNAFGYNTYLYRKFVPEGNMGGLIDDRFHSPVNFPLIRYADVLLMLAECYNKTGNQTGAVDYINLVRNRVGMPGINSGPAWLEARSEEAVFERIKRERAVELAAEGVRFHDLKRWGLLEKEVNNLVQYDLLDKALATKKVAAKNYLWPIPQTEIEKNSKLTQNTGWGS